MGCNVSCRTGFAHKSRRGAAAGDIFDVFTNEARVKGFTQSDATVSREVGGEFKMFGGSIEGVQRMLEPGKLIVQDWRFTTWPDGLYSKACFPPLHRQCNRAPMLNLSHRVAAVAARNMVP